jgi:hypothetical protein
VVGQEGPEMGQILVVTVFVIALGWLTLISRSK